MSANKLKLNEDKTELMLVGTGSKLKHITVKAVDLGNQIIPTSNHLKNLGILMDSGLTMEKHISHLCKTCYLKLRRIAQIRPYITTEAANKLVCSFVLSRLDYCNSLLVAIPDKKLQQLQQIQNNAARLVSQVSKREHVTPIFKDLHWLPVASRIKYKIACITYQCQSVPEFPSYLKDAITPYKPSRSLRSANKKLLVKPRVSLKTYGERSFYFQSAAIWNDLPVEIQSAKSVASFKSKLKTYYYTLSF